MHQCFLLLAAKGTLSGTHSMKPSFFPKFKMLKLVLYYPEYKGTETLLYFCCWHKKKQFMIKSIVAIFIFKKFTTNRVNFTYVNCSSIIRALKTEVKFKISLPAKNVCVSVNIVFNHSIIASGSLSFTFAILNMFDSASGDGAYTLKIEKLSKWEEGWFLCKQVGGCLPWSVLCLLCIHSNFLNFLCICLQ